MKLLFDQNISFRVVKKLPESFAQSVHIKSVGLMNASDFEIWEFARKFGYTIVTQDADFNDINLVFGFPPKIIWLKTGNMRTDDIARVISQFESQLEDFIQDNEIGCFEIYH